MDVCGDRRYPPGGSSLSGIGTPVSVSVADPRPLQRHSILPRRRALAPVAVRRLRWRAPKRKMGFLATSRTQTLPSFHPRRARLDGCTETRWVHGGSPHPKVGKLVKGHQDALYRVRFPVFCTQIMPSCGARMRSDATPKRESWSSDRFAMGPKSGSPCVRTRLRMRPSRVMVRCVLRVREWDAAPSARRGLHLGGQVLAICIATRLARCPRRRSRGCRRRMVGPRRTADECSPGGLQP